MINVEDIIYEAKVNGYYHYYDVHGFISVFDETVSVNKNAQCLFRTKVNCCSKKDFEMESIYASQKVFELTLS